MPRPSIETAGGWRDKAMVDRDGAPLGRIAHIYLDRVTGEPAWALVATGQGARRVFVPLVDAAEQQDQVRVPAERALVSDAPAVRAGRRLSKEDTARLHGHYGGAPELRWASARRAPGGGLPARLRRGLGQARQRAASTPAVRTRRGRRLLAAGAAVSSVAGGLLLARRRQGRRSSGLVDAVGRTVGSVVALPAGALRRRRSRRPRKRRRRMAGNLKLLAGLAAGYVLGARAGRERYEQIAEATRRLVERPEVREGHGRTRSQPPQAGRAEESERDAGEALPGAGPSGRGRRERSPSGR